MYFVGDNIFNVIPGCAVPEWKGDNYCDDENNNAGCDYDGGDCCGTNVNTYFCSACQCLDPFYLAGKLFSKTTILEQYLEPTGMVFNICKW